MKQSNAERVIENYLCCSQWAEPKDQLRLTKDYEIMDRGTIIGKIVDGEISEDWWQTFLVLTLQEFKSQKNWATHKKQLAKVANENGLIVVFVDQLDMGFGVRDTKNTPAVSTENTYKTLIKVAKFSQDEDIKTAAMCFKDGAIYATSYNQYVNGKWIHAEEALCKYCLAMDEDEMHTTEMLDWQMLLEPCFNCLDNMIQLGAQQVVYAQNHKPKWDTPSYIQLTNDVSCGIITSARGHKIKMRKVQTKETIKFMEAKKA